MGTSADARALMNRQFSMVAAEWRIAAEHSSRYNPVHHMHTHNFQERVPQHGHDIIKKHTLALTVDSNFTPAS